MKKEEHRTPEGWKESDKKNTTPKSYRDYVQEGDKNSKKKDKREDSSDKETR